MITVRVSLRALFLIWLTTRLSTTLAVAAPEQPVLKVTGEVKKPLSLTMTQIKALSSATRRATDHDGTTASYEGILLHRVLELAGVAQGEALRGDALRLCALVKAADGYQVVFALPEFDPMFADKEVLLAF